MAFDWLSKLLQGSEQTRGLSGESASAVAFDGSNSFYNFRLRRHYTDYDMVEEPRRLWRTLDDLDATGLSAHIRNAGVDGDYTDVLLVLSREDHERSVAAGPGWQDEVGRILHELYITDCRNRGIQPAAPGRPLGVWVVGDASREIGGTDFGMVEGEFITGILPNLYRKPGPSSSAVIGLHVNMPGVWEGYREVGRLYDDQILFTIGDHWLDNFSHPSLRESAVYRLQRHTDGSFYHIINPDLQDSYQVTSTDQEGTSVLTLATRAGEPLAYMVLAVIEEEEPVPGAEPGNEIRIADLGQPTVAPPMLIDDRLQPVESLGLGSKTIIPEAHQERIFTLQERGALLQKVHFGAFMLGYDVFLGRRGELGTVVDEVAATFQVRKRLVSLLANGAGVVVDGTIIPPGESMVIEGNARIQVGAQTLEYRDLRGVAAEGWPYVGEIVRPASSTYMLFGRTYAVGRSRECRVVLPDEPRNENIVWKPKVGEGATIRSKTGEIPKSRFYTDSIMVASEHAAIDLEQDPPRITCRARHCYVYIRRGPDVLALYPATSTQPKTQTLRTGDEVLIGNCLFHIGFSADDDAYMPPPRGAADSLADAVDAPAFAVDTSEPVEVQPAFSLEQGLGLNPSEAPAAEHSSLPTPEAVDEGAGWGDVPDSFEREIDGIAKLGAFADLPQMHSISDVPDMRRPPPPLELPDEIPSDPTEEVDDDLLDLPPLSPAFGGLPEPVEANPVVAAPQAPSAEAAEPMGGTWPTWEPPPRGGSQARTAPRALGGDGRLDPELHHAPTAEVAMVDDGDSQFELGRKAQLRLVGWSVSGEVVCGNHTGADIVLPENRIEAGQIFDPRNYFRLKVRGKRAKLSPLDPEEFQVDGASPEEETYAAVEDHRFEVLRRDEDGDEDFRIALRLEHDAALPDPRARLLSLDHDEPMVGALFTMGLPLRSDRRLTVGELDVVLHFDGEVVTLSEHLATYRRADGSFLPFFHQPEGGSFRTVPEDGSSVRIAPGDRVLVGHAVYQFRVEA